MGKKNEWIISLLLFEFVFSLPTSHDLHFRHHPVSSFRTEAVEVLAAPFSINCTVSICRGPLSPIYCHGDILSTAWQFGLEQTCPGEKLRVPADQVLDAFARLEYPLKKDVFQRFCESNFENTTYLEPVILEDWSSKPTFLQKIGDPFNKKLAAALHEKWSLLARKVQRRVFDDPDLYPFLPVRHPFVAPGGRFEFYFYWDTYWIVKGLLISGMNKTVNGIIGNFASLVEEHGFIPNSGNIQLSRRSQPPLFVHMIYDYYNATKDIDSLKTWMNPMIKEIDFWLYNRTVDVGQHKLFIYKPETNCPRPENLLADYKLGMSSNNALSTWRSIAAACESGWDFSSRWMNRNGSTAYNPATIHADKIVPVDLNVFMARNFLYLSKLQKVLGNEEQAVEYRKKFENLKAAIHSVFWVATKGAWFDYDLTTETNNIYFHPSNVYPLLLEGLESYSDDVAKYIKETGVLNYQGGVPATLPVPSSEQWDFPNVWAPNQHLLIESFRASNNSFLIDSANDQAGKFIRVVYNGLFFPPEGQKGGVWEKYDARSGNGTRGGGGEYDVQEGFGWTNGAVLDLIMKSPRPKNDGKPGLFGSPFQATIVISSWALVALIAIWYCLRACTSPKTSNIYEDAEARTGLLSGNEDESD